MKHWIEGHWYYSPERLAMRYIRSGEYEPNEEPVEVAEEITTSRLPGLFQAAMEAGVLPLTPGRDTRTEDLKIIHRLLDIMSKSIGVMP